MLLWKVSGKCEFKSSAAAHGNFVPPPFESVENTPELAARYPLNIVSPAAHGFLNSQYANEPKQLRRQGDSVVIMHPADAELRGIAGGDAVRVFNDRGNFTGSALVSTDTIPGVVASFLGHWAINSKSKTAVNSISSDRQANIGRAPTFSDNLVQVAKAETL